MTPPSVVVLGAGPAGLGAALELAERGVDVDVLERAGAVGGNAGSFEIEGLRVDYGSHRLHPASDPAVLERIQSLLGEDLLERPRHGRIHLLGNWIHFPLRPLDLALRMPPRFAFGAATDLARKLLPGGQSADDAHETFASVLERGLGATICREFYFPYARKIWGLEPEEIAATQAHKRVSAGSIGKLLRRLLPGGVATGAATRKGTFFYPRRGFGQISESIGAAAIAAGARLALGSSVRAVHRPEAPGDPFRVEVERDGECSELRAQHLWSTIPSALLARLLSPALDSAVLESTKRLELRAMLLVYLVLEQDQFSEYDAHYFPGADLPFTRVSEPKNYAACSEPAGLTVLCAEFPCGTQDAIWSQEDDALAAIVLGGLRRAGLPEPARLRKVEVRRLPAAYPIYREGYEEHFERIDQALANVDRLLSFGRQGLFAHDNTHHALYMARAAADCLDPHSGHFDSVKWSRYRAIFETHVVED